MRLLALDIGKRRTGVAFADDIVGIPLALDTLLVKDEADLVSQILQLCDEREIDLLVIGLPLLLSGQEGEQSSFVRLIGSRLEDAEVPVEYLDERYTSQPFGKLRVTSTEQLTGGKKVKASDTTDDDARAACGLLQLFLERREIDE